MVALVAGAYALLAPTTASALTCTVLPQNICNDASKGGSGTDLSGTGIWDILLLVLNIMTALVGVAAVGALGFAGFLYATAADDASKVKHAKDMILNTCIGIVAYGLMYVGLNFLIPGGIFS